MRLALATTVSLQVAVAAAAPRWQTCPLPPAMPTPAAYGYVAVDGASIYFATLGEPHNPPIILLHGGLGTSDHWSYQVPSLLEAGFRVIAIDSRGHGRSTRTLASASYGAMAKDVIAVMNELKVEKAAIAGWSDGGDVALHLAIDKPERVDKLFVFGTNYDVSGRRRRGGQRDATFRVYMAKSRADYQKLSATPTQWSALVDWLRPMWNNSVGFTPEQLRAISAQTLVVGAEHDELIVAGHFQAMSSLIPKSRFAIVKDASHFAPWQAPSEFSALLVDFLRR